MPHRLLILTAGWLFSASLLVASASGQSPPEEKAGPAAVRGVRAESGDLPGLTDQGPSRTYANRHALVIGIDEYTDPGYPDLDYAVADARAIAKSLVGQFQFPEKNVRLMLNENATKDAVEEALEDWACNASRVGENDLFVVFFAGHGVTRSARRGDRGYVVPVDGRQRNGEHVWSSLIGMTDFEEVSEVIPAKHALFVLDCCFGGLALKRSDPPIAAGLTSRARQVLTAGGAEQEVLDTGGGGHSVFTGALLSALRGDADLDGDGAVTFGEIFNHVGREVQLLTENAQTPLQSTFPDHGGGCVALFKPGLEPGRQSIHERLSGLELSLEQELEERKRFADIVALEDLQEQAQELYAGITTEDSAYREWLVRARDVESRKPRHMEALQRVRQQVYLNQILSGAVEEGEGVEPDWSKADGDSRFRYRMFRQLVQRITDDLVPLIATIEARREVASQIWQATIGDQQEAWDEAIASIANRAECPQYDGLTIAPQLGLIPIGRDSESGLWEFGLWKQTGRVPRRGEDRLLIPEEDNGLVFVLIPGGTFQMGATSVRSRRADREGTPYNFDPHASRIESPVHTVTLDAFFLSKYEMTQGQWKAFTGSNPSRYRRGAYEQGYDRLPPDNKFYGLHPVEQVDVIESERVLRQLGLLLPTEAQWEYAARAGSHHPWWPGRKPEDLQGVANLSDAYSAANGAPFEWAVEEGLNDGFTTHSPVGWYRANPFGLHDVHGNVMEWCRDRYGSYSLPVRPGDGLRIVDGTNHYRIARGGSYGTISPLARSALRLAYTPERGSFFLGLRPSRAITPK